MSATTTWHQKRNQQTTGRIMAAARAMLARDGLNAFSIERLATESGIAKTTIYRRTRDSRQLALMAMHPNTEMSVEMVMCVADRAQEVAGELLDQMDGTSAEVLLACALVWLQDSKPVADQ